MELNGERKTGIMYFTIFMYILFRPSYCVQFYFKINFKRSYILRKKNPDKQKDELPIQTVWQFKQLMSDINYCLTIISTLRQSLCLRTLYMGEKLF